MDSSLSQNTTEVPSTNDTLNEQPTETTEEQTPIERTRQTFSHNANELRQRNGFKEPSQKETVFAITNNYKDDSCSNGEGFYECNIW